MPKIIKLVDDGKMRRKPVKKQMRPAKKARGPKRGSYAAGTLSLPLATELMQSQEAMPPLHGRTALLEAGVLAFRREAHGATRILLISKKRTKKWGIPKGKLSPFWLIRKDEIELTALGENFKREPEARKS